MADGIRVLVLMTTCDSQEFLAAQLDSILDQEGVEVFLRVSDDCSTDSTFRILETYAEEFPNMSIVYNSIPQGMPRSLMKMVYEAPADEYDFIALANADEVWLPRKLRSAVEHISANTSRPELYYAGVEFIDDRGDSLGTPFRDYDVCAAHPASLLLVRNWASLGTMVMNGALVKLLRRRRVFDFMRSPAAWMHAVALYCGGFVYGDLAHVVAIKHAKGPDVLEHDDFSAEDASCFTAMAQVFLREYERMMDAQTAKLVEAVAVRHVSSKARRYLAGRTDIVLPSHARTSKLRWRILRNRF